MSFRSKLLLAMMLVVGGVSGTILFELQKRIQANYTGLFRKQFERELGYFLSRQEARLDAVKRQTLRLSELPAVVTNLGQARPSGESLYLAGSNDTRLVMVSMFAEVRLAFAGNARRFQTVFFRFLDREGRTLDPPEAMRRQMGMPNNKRRVEQKLAGVRGALDKPERQQVGYLDLLQEATNFARLGPRAARASAQEIENAAEAGGTPELQEIIMTKVLAPETGQTLGAIVIGFPVADLVPQSRQTNSTQTEASEPFQRGILLEDHLYANTNEISESAGEIVAEVIARSLRTTDKSQADVVCRVEGQDFQVFYQLLNPDSAFPPAYQVCIYSMAEARREQRDLFWKVAGSSAAGLVVAFLLSFLLANGLSVPLRELVKGTTEIQQGNFGVQVPVRSRDELGRLASSFNEMAEGLAQKERYRTVLNLVADEKIAHQLVNGDLTLGGEVREVTVLFCDIRGFTELTEGMPPGEVIEMLNEHMTALTAVVKAHNGVLDKFVGDLLMAVFGAPIRYENETLEAARCALQLQEERNRLNKVSRHKLRVGIGLATGEVVAGCMGSTERLNYTVLGERVNLASRLCDEAGPGQVLIDQPTLDRLGELITAEPVAPMSLKGFAAPVRVYQLIAVRAAGRTH